MLVTAQARAALRVALGAAGLALAVLAVPTRARAQADALTLNEVLDLRRRGVSNRQILRAASDYCVAFAVTDSVERAIAQSGGDSALVSGLRTACGAPTTRVAPGVLVDDDISGGRSLGAFVSSDQLCMARLESHGVRIENRRRRGGCVIAYPSDPVSGNVRIALTMSDLLGGRDAQVVLGFGRSDSWDQYSIVVSGAGRVEMCRAEREGCKSLITRVGVTNVRAGPETTNELAVEIRGRVIQLFVNGERLGEYQAPEPPSGGLVLGVGASSSAVFRHLSVRQLERTAASR